jgi:predicted O-methyltransferase YrrM
MNALLDIPTAMTEPEALAIQQLAMDKRVLEVGALLGFSTIMMAKSAIEVVSIDPHAGYPADNPRDTWGSYNENLLRYDVADKVWAIRDTDQVLTHVEEFVWPDDDPTHPQRDPGELKDFGFAFIDCDGTYDTTIRVMERVAPFLTLDNGIMAVHDYDLPEWPGAGEAVRDFCTQSGARFGLIDTLAVIRVAHPDD